MPKNITIYTSNNCASCGMVKQYLAMKGTTYDEINIETQPEKQQEMIALTGQMRVPVVVVTKDDGTQDVSIGYNLGKLSAALA